MNLHDQDTVDRMWIAVKTILTWIAAALGIGTFAGLVNIVVGMLSACWVGYQLYAALNYDLPIKRAKLKALRDQQHDALDSTQPGSL